MSLGKDGREYDGFASFPQGSLFDVPESNCQRCGRPIKGDTCLWCDGPDRGGLQLKEEGMARALTKNNIDGWKVDFRLEVLNRLAGDTFTSEDITDVVGLPSGATTMNGNNAVGAIMNGLAKRGLIQKTSGRVQSKHPRSHGAELVVWMRTSNIGVA